MSLSPNDEMARMVELLRVESDRLRRENQELRHADSQLRAEIRSRREELVAAGERQKILISHFGVTLDKLKEFVVKLIAEAPGIGTDAKTNLTNEVLKAWSPKIQ